MEAIRLSVVSMHQAMAFMDVGYTGQFTGPHSNWWFMALRPGAGGVVVFSVLEKHNTRNYVSNCSSKHGFIEGFMEVLTGTATELSGQ